MFHQKVLPVIRIYLYLMLISLCLFLAVGIILVLAQPHLDKKPASFLGATSSISDDFLKDMLTMEVPHLKKSNESYTFSTKNVISLLTEMLLQINVYSPRSLIAASIPNMNLNKPIVLYKGQEHDDFPTDNPEPDSSTSTLHEASQLTPSEQNGSVATPPDPENNQQLSEGVGNDSTLIYHTHNRESWLPELPSVKDPNLAFDKTKNVTLLGARLKERLKENGIVASHSVVDYHTLLPKFLSKNAYIYSHNIIKEALASQKNIKYLIDIHRDSGSRRSTTLSYNGQDYAQVYFVVGMENSNWKKNNDFAKRISEKLDKRVPGISKGIYGKDHNNGNGKYNQDLSPNSSLIEVGGVENTLEESYRTIDVLANVIAELVHEDNNSTKS